jgi:hypothetical protein
MNLDLPDLLARLDGARAILTVTSDGLDDPDAPTLCPHMVASLASAAGVLIDGAIDELDPDDVVP